MEVTVRSIQSEDDYDAALADVETLMDAVPGTPEGARLDVLATLIEAYEARNWKIDAPDPIEAIRVRMEQKNLRQRDLQSMVGSRGRISEILARKRALTLPMIRKLSRGLDLPADLLIQEISLAPRQRTAAAKRTVLAKQK
jgi:HTH-type transcriptional regulator/antitoxin HigA